MLYEAFRGLGRQTRQILRLRFWQYDKGLEMAEAARRRVIISGFGVTSPFVILSRKQDGWGRMIGLTGWKSV